jgi:hypothetical protein
MPLTGNLAKINSLTGFYGATISLTAANGFEISKSYTIQARATVEFITVIKNFDFYISPDIDLSLIAKTTELSSVKLASDGLDAIALTEATARPTNFREFMIGMARRLFNKSKLTQTTLTIYKDNGTDIASEQTVMETETEQNIGSV